MPIARDFFSTFESLNISCNPWVLIDGLLDFIARIKGENPQIFLRNNIDIEELYSEIEANLKLHTGKLSPDRTFAFKSYTQLVFIFSSVINEIQNGPRSKTHSELAKRLTSQDVVITFNWDTLMDRALRHETDWTTDEGYGFTPKSIYRDTWAAPVQSKKQMPKLIKLHGSVNWLSGYPMSPEEDIELMQEAAPGTVWIYESTIRPYSCYAGRYMSGYQEFSYGYYPPNILDDPGKRPPEGFVTMRMRPKFPWMPEGEADDKGLVSIPLIIPPVKEKNYDGYGVLFENLWETAQSSIKDAVHIIIIGYSFPKTDFKSNSLFLKAFSSRGNIPFVTILDPNPGPIADKFKYEFGIPNSYLRVIKGYFSEKTDINKLFSTNW